MPGRVNGFSLAYTAIGGVVLWSGIKGTTLSSTFKGLLQGQAPTADEEPIAAASSSADGPAGSTANVAALPGSASQDTFIKALLAAIGAPATQANISSLTNWMAHEEPTSDWDHWNNPMNTTLNEPGAVSENSVNVRSYPSISEGLTATVDTLLGGGYSDILMQLRAGRGLTSGASAGLLRWSGGSYSSV